MYQHIHTQHLHGWQLVLVIPVHHGDGVQVQLLLLQVTLYMGGHFYDGINGLLNILSYNKRYFRYLAW